MAVEYLAKLNLKPWVYEIPQQYESFWFEKIDGNELRVWTREQFPICVAICAVYLLFVHYGPLWMKNRKAFKLKTPLILWNFLLAVFSSAGAIRLFPDLIYALKRPNGFHRSTCDLSGAHYAATFWGFLFAVSKVAEFMDTVFIVLRKKPLVFLHWFHHFSMALASFYVFTEGESYMRYCAVINYSIHSIMYSYYTIKALRIHVPKTISMMITSAQLFQFVGVLAVNLYSFIRYASVGDCYRTTSSIIVSFICGTAYLYLFSVLFYKSYISKEKAKHD